MFTETFLGPVSPLLSAGIMTDVIKLGSFTGQSLNLQQPHASRAAAFSLQIWTT